MKKHVYLFFIFIFAFIFPTVTSGEEGQPPADGTIIVAPPVVHPISNKDKFITGTGVADHKVVFKIGSSTYSTTTSTTGGFKFTLPNSKPLAAGVTLVVFIKDSVNNVSESVTIKVADKIPPVVPRVGKITDKSLVIKGKTEPNAYVYIKRNAKSFKTVMANSSGAFTVGIPLQDAGWTFDFYAVDAAKNISATTREMVTAQARPAQKLMYAPLVRQLPELPRGCEVTSLTMMLNYAGIKANKMTLAKQVKKDPTPLTYKNDRKYFGNPHIGFVGDMYSFSKPGFGVFHRPIAALGEQYLPNRIVNLSGSSFNSVLNYVAAGRPVWVINTSTFTYLPSSYWQTWYTAQGPVRITMKEHSVLITGYNSQYVYFNDPLDGMKNKKRPLKQFVEGWNQYGKQAISYF